MYKGVLPSTLKGSNGPTSTDLFRRVPTGNKSAPKQLPWRDDNIRSNAVLEGLNRVRLHDLARRLGLHHDYFAEDLPLARLRRRLCARLDPAKAGHSEDTTL